jgi:hypothetical protein
MVSEYVDHVALRLDCLHGSHKFSVKLWVQESHVTPMRFSRISLFLLSYIFWDTLAYFVG